MSVVRTVKVVSNYCTNDPTKGRGISYMEQMNNTMMDDMFLPVHQQQPPDASSPSRRGKGYKVSWQQGRIKFVLEETL
jgi:hypothetical protein